MAIVENNPVTSLKSIFDLSEGGALHFFSHGSFLSGELLELSGVLIDLRSRISSSGKEVENRLVGERRTVDIRNCIIHGSTEFRVQSRTDEHIGCNLSSVFTEASHEAELQERSENSVGVNLVIVIGHGLRLRIIRLIEGSPFRTTTSHGVD
jgi:hypothetical protein